MTSPSSGPARRVAVVTGAGSGLGRVIAHALAADGLAVALFGRTAKSLAATAADCPPGAETLVVPTDVTVPESVTSAFSSVLAEWGRVDLLVNNAGMFGPTGDPDEIPVQGFVDTIAVNLTGSFLCAREAFAVMKRQGGGRIINNGSISAHVPRPGSAAYTSSKHAISGLTRSLALDGRPHRISVGQIDIGNAATEMTAGMSAGVRQADGSLRSEPTFDPTHVGDAVVAMARLPLDVSVPSMTIMAAQMPFLGRG